MPIADLHGLPLHYEISGKAGAPVLLLSSSLGTTLDMWRPQLPAFQPHFQVLRYDMRGHGSSGTPAGPYTIDQLGNDVLAILDVLQIEKINYCGLSIGGIIGQWLGTHAPSRIEKLVLCNTGAKIGTAESWNARIETVRSEGIAPIVDGVLSRWFTAPFLASGSPVLARMRAMVAANNIAGYVAACAAVRDIDLRKSIAQITLPTLIIAGEEDLATTVADSRFLQERIPGAKLITLPAAHISSAELPEQFNAAVLQFLTPDGVKK